MEITVVQPFFEEIKKASKILIALPENVSIDDIASAKALALFLLKLNKEVTLVCSGSISTDLSFLPNNIHIEQGLQASKSFVIKLSTKSTAVSEISYQTDPEALNIFVKAKSGFFKPEDVTFGAEASPFNLVIILGCISLDSLGVLFETNAELFFNTPKINIDIHAGNQYFGAINIIDINISSVSEMLSEIFSLYEQQLVDEDIATCLLAGIIAKTNSFQHTQTTPRAFMKASELLALGGRQQDVVRFLYKTKPLPLLKLWGRALARLQVAQEGKVLYAVLHSQDMEKAGASALELPGVLKELIENISGYETVFILIEQETSVLCFMATQPYCEIKNVSMVLGSVFTPIALNSGNFIGYSSVISGLSISEVESKMKDALHA